MQRRNFIRLAGGGIVTAAIAAPVAGCSSAYPAQAVEAWNGPAASETEARRWALAHAITAPNPHNLQPWLVDLREAGVITLCTDPQRVLPETDPLGRQILIGHGAFIELLVIALAQQGLQADVSLWPQGELPAALKAWDKRPVARLVLKPGGTPDPLFSQILKRHTPKASFDTQRSIPQDAVLALQNSLTGRAARLQISTDRARVASLRELCMQAALVEFGTQRTMMETIRLIRLGPEEILRHRDGVSINSPMIRTLASVGLFDRSRAPRPGDSGHQGAVQRYERATQTAMGFVWLSSPNTRRDQIEAGRAYIRLQLKATELGIGMNPLSQALQEFPEMRAHYEQAHQMLLGKPAPSAPREETVQMLCRIGYVMEAVQPSPRRAMAQFVV